MSRKVDKVILTKEELEGPGMRVRHCIAEKQRIHLDPFLLMDEFKIQKPAGFPDHPHRGFESVTYMLNGGLRHEDSCGNKATSTAGDLQCMTAGRGIMHCEMPEEVGEAHGINFWVNLARSNRNIEPTFYQLRHENILTSTRDGVTVKVIAGEALGVKIYILQSPMYTRTPTMYLDFQLENGAVLNQPIPDGWHAFVYVISGYALFGPEESATRGLVHNTLLLGQAGSLHVRNSKHEPCRFLLIGGQPLNEPVVHKGPFVVNEDYEIEETVTDYILGRNGFKRSHTWRSDR